MIFRRLYISVFIFLSYQVTAQKVEILQLPENDGYKSFQEGMLPFQKDDKWGFYNKKLQIVIVNRFEDVSEFKEGFSCVKINGKWGVIDTRGRVIIQAKFDKISQFNLGHAVVEKVGKKGIIDSKGKIIIKPVYSDLEICNNGFVMVTNDEKKIGFIDLKGKIEINYQFDESLGFFGGYAPVRKGKLWGIIDTKGRLIVDYSFLKVTAIIENTFCFKGQEDLWGIYTLNKGITIPRKYDEVKVKYPGDLFIKSFENKLLIKRNGKWGYIIPNSGKLKIENKYEDAFPFFRNTAPVKVDGKWGIIDVKGRLIAKYQFDEIFRYNEDVSLVKKDDMFYLLRISNK